jgi:hypothetical protein
MAEEWDSAIAEPAALRRSHEDRRRLCGKRSDLRAHVRPSDGSIVQVLGSHGTFRPIIW